MNDTDDTTTTEPPGDTLVALWQPLQMPAPAVLREALLLRLEGLVVDARRERGTVRLPEDTYALVRTLMKSGELLGEYRSAIGAAEKFVTGEIAEELTEAVGEQDGVPMGNLTVPDVDGTNIRLVRDQANTYSIDTSALIAVVIADVMSSWVLVERVRDASDTTHASELLVAGLQYAFDRLLTTGRFEPQSSKLNAYAMDLAGTGRDDLAAAVSSAVAKRSTYRGVKSERVARKKRP